MPASRKSTSPPVRPPPYARHSPHRSNGHSCCCFCSKARCGQEFRPGGLVAPLEGTPAPARLHNGRPPAMYVLYCEQGIGRPSTASPTGAASPLFGLLLVQGLPECAYITHRPLGRSTCLGITLGSGGLARRRGPLTVVYPCHTKRSVGSPASSSVAVSAGEGVQAPARRHKSVVGVRSGMCLEASRGLVNFGKSAPSLPACVCGSPGDCVCAGWRHAQHERRPVECFFPVCPISTRIRAVPWLDVGLVCHLLPRDSGSTWSHF
ncbi:hypothetical protein CDD83_11098 [Cordyceps sp. RAO-2017]|nr:hypothetical protein CDD83_11098 [Cordyceps sp. RAO-2017]